MSRRICVAVVALLMASGGSSSADSSAKKALVKIDCAKLRTVDRWQSSRALLTRHWSAAERQRGALAMATRTKVVDITYRAFLRSAHSMVAPLRRIAREMKREKGLFLSLGASKKSYLFVPTARILLAARRLDTRPFRSMGIMTRRKQMQRRATALLRPVVAQLSGLAHVATGIGKADWIRKCRAQAAARKAKLQGKATRVVSFKVETADTALSQAQVRKVLRKQALMIRLCADRGKGTVRGTVKVSFRVKPDGTVAKARIRSSSIKNAAVRRCVLRTLEPVRFPRSGRGARVTYPFVF